MRILLQAKHQYPAKNGGPGGGRVFDCLAKGLAELGHQVFYFLPRPPLEPMPHGVFYTDSLVDDVDIYHVRSDSPLCKHLQQQGVPWVATCHTDPAVWGLTRALACDNWISVSKQLADSLAQRRFIHNGIDPCELIFSEQKQAYLLFAATLRLADKKGLDLAIEVAKACGKTLYVAGSDPDQSLTYRIKTKVENAGMVFLGEIEGEYKAQVFAKAQAFIFPTQINEAFGLVLAEALMSGTPVITSFHGACKEIVTEGLGFVCDTFDDYVAAVKQIDEIDSHYCRQSAMKRFHYLTMAKQYVEQYQLFINKNFDCCTNQTLEQQT